MKSEMKNIDYLKNSEDISCYDNEVSNGIKIVRVEGKNCIDKRFGMALEERTAPRYYFEYNGNRISKDYYSIEKLDDIHYVVSDLDFMYSLGFNQWESIYGNEFEEVDYVHFKFHKGIVAVIENNIVEVVPTIYKNFKLTNSNIVFTKGDPIYKLIYDKYGWPINFERQTDKIGCINLDPKSEHYGYVVAPIIFDSIFDFDLEFEGFAFAKIGTHEGYICKEMDIDRYNDFLIALIQFKNKNISYKTYKQLFDEFITKILFTKEEVIDHINNVNQKGVSKTIVKLHNKNGASQ